MVLKPKVFFLSAGQDVGCGRVSSVALTGSFRSFLQGTLNTAASTEFGYFCVNSGYSVDSWCLGNTALNSGTKEQEFSSVEVSKRTRALYTASSGDIL